MSRRASAVMATGLTAVFFATFIPGLVFNHLNAADAQPLAERVALVVGFSGFQIIGAIVASRRPEHPMGWMLCAVALLASSGFTLEELSAYTLITNPGAVWGGYAAGWFASWLWYPTLVLALFYIPLLFPDGRLPSPRWRWVVIATTCTLVATCASFALWPTLDVGVEGDAAQIENPLAVSQLEPVLDVVVQISFPIFAVAVFLAALSVLLRFRASRGEARQQLKWFALGVVVVAISVPVEAVSYRLGSVFFAIGILAVPISIGIAVLRYRLYDVDRLINRSLVYGLLTAGLGLTYFGLVVALQALLQPFSGGSDLAIVMTTLVVATLFLPARRRVQDVVDRRFNRRAYDAARTVEAFSARLREQVDLDTLRYELLAVVDETMQPALASLWLREGTPR
jgi:hypothetical protein